MRTIAGLWLGVAEVSLDSPCTGEVHQGFDLMGEGTSIRAAVAQCA